MILCVQRQQTSGQFITSWQHTYTAKDQQEGWQILDHEPSIDEHLIYDAEQDQIKIEALVLSPEAAIAEQQRLIKKQLVDELPEIILQNKDNPEALVQTLCDRAKQIETETTSDDERNPKTV